MTPETRLALIDQTVRHSGNMLVESLGNHSSPLTINEHALAMAAIDALAELERALAEHRF